MVRIKATGEVTEVERTDAGVAFGGKAVPSSTSLDQKRVETAYPNQYGIYQACILNGISYKAYADQMGVSYQSVQNAIRLIQKKSKKYFWVMVVVC